MTKKNSSTRWIGSYTSKEFSKPEKFSIEEISKNTTYIGSTFNLLDHKVKSLDIDQIRMAIIRAKQDYGKVFEKLAAED